MTNTEEKSPHWDACKDLPLLQQGFHDCWPCREGFPQFPWRGTGGIALFEIVTAWGRRAEAWIDDTREFASEGLEWVIVEGQRRRNVEAIQVAGWRRIPERSQPHRR